MSLRLHSTLFFALLASVPGVGAAQVGPYCPAQTNVVPGTCICPPGLSFRMNTTATHQCGADGQCVCTTGTWNGSVCSTSPAPAATATVAAAAVTTTATGPTPPTTRPATGPAASAPPTTPPPPAVTAPAVVPPTTSAPNTPTAACNVATCPIGQVCAAGACVLSSPMRFTLTWTPSADLDLQIVAPGGVTVDHQHRQGGGGVLDRDDALGNGPENVFWSQRPDPGYYHVCVASWGLSRPVPFQVQIALPDGSVRNVQGQRTSTLHSRCSHGSPTNVASVTISPTGVATISMPGEALPSAHGATGPAAPAVTTPATTAPATGPTPPSVVVVPNPSQRPMSFDVRLATGSGQPTRGAEVRFLAWNRQPFAARLEGTTFVIAPNGDFSQARRDSVLQFLGWDGARWSAQVNGTAWTVYPTTQADRGRYEPVLPYVQWDGQRATAQIVP